MIHLKRPALVPILDRRLVHLYRPAAARWARTLAEVRDREDGLWPAIRADVIDEGNRRALAQCRRHLAGRGGVHQLVSTLSDLRLLDMVA